MYVLHNNVYNYYINTILMSTTILYTHENACKYPIKILYIISY